MRRPKNPDESEYAVRIEAALDWRYEEFVWPSLAQIREMTAKRIEWYPQRLQLLQSSRGERHRLPLPARVKCWGCGTVMLVRP